LQGVAFCYLATLMDRYSCDIVNWELAETMTDDLTMAVLRMAIRERQPPVGKRWAADVSMGFTPSGRRKRKRIYGDTQRQRS
jgi:transposase InsO family protein